jgi:hypothetical protein
MGLSGNGGKILNSNADGFVKSRFCELINAQFFDRFHPAFAFTLAGVLESD